MEKKLKIAKRRSAIHGNGVIATAPIRKGEHIVEYKGTLISHATADDGYHGDLTSGHTFLFTLNDDWIIDANQGGNIAKWINCSCEPNAIAFVHEHPSKDTKRDQVIIEALRAIKPGEEVTYDYGFEFDVPYTPELLKAWACHCGSPNCRGTMLSPKQEEAPKKDKKEKTGKKEKKHKKDKERKKKDGKKKDRKDKKKEKKSKK